MTDLKYFRSLLPAIFFLFTSPLVYSQSNNIKQKDKKIIIQEPKDSVKQTGSYSALVYFSGNGLEHAIVATYSTEDLNSLMESIHRDSKGAFVTFDYLKFTNSKGITKDITDIPYHFSNLKKPVTINNPSVEELNKLITLNFVSGTIYFAGSGYSNVVSVKATDSVALFKCYQRYSPGSKIAFDNCIYKNADGKLSLPLNKSVTLE